MKKVRLLMLGSTLLLVTAASASFPKLGPSCICPENYAPVLCSDGNTYGNACFAACSGATGCVRVPDAPFS